jgi:hypothetical protein
MAGKGDMVEYQRLTATTPEQREELKRDIERILNTATGTVTVIALLGKPAGEKKG